MDITEVATEARESAKAAHQRIDELTAEVKDIRGLTAAMAAVNQKVDGLTTDVVEIKSDVKTLSNRPGKWWDTLMVAAIGAIVAVICKFL